MLYKNGSSEKLQIFPVSIIMFYFMTVKKVCLFRSHLVNTLAHRFVITGYKNQEIWLCDAGQWLS